MIKPKHPLDGLSEEVLARIGDALQGAFYSHMYDLVEKVRTDVVDELRIAPLASELRAVRERRGLDLKAAAKLVKVPQYVVRQLEMGKVGDVGPGVIERYAVVVGAKEVFDRWKLENPDLALRLGRPKDQPALMTLLEQQVLSHVLRGGQQAAVAREPSPARSSAPGPPRALQLKIVLEETRPAIWRKVVVSDDTTLAGLHEVIQTAMGWMNSHLYLFEVGARRYVDPDLMDDPDPDDQDARRTRLSDLALTPKAEFSYEYDFGDGWGHRITVEGVGEIDEGAVYPSCVGGARACPPEDCGGPHGYQELIKVLANRSHPEYGATRKWLGHELDPGAFDLEAVNQVLGGRPRRRRR